MLAGDEALIALNGTYGADLPVSASMDPAMISLIEGVKAAKDNKARTELHDELALLLAKEHDWKWMLREHSLDQDSLPLYVERVKRGTLFRITDYDGLQVCWRCARCVLESGSKAAHYGCRACRRWSRTSSLLPERAYISWLSVVRGVPGRHHGGIRQG